MKIERTCSLCGKKSKRTFDDEVDAGKHTQKFEKSVQIGG